MRSSVVAIFLLKMIRINCLIILLVLVVCMPKQSFGNYCDRSLCRGAHHIACGNSGHFASRCRNARIAGISPNLRNAILHQHNHLRNWIASGKLNRFESASNMPTLKWNQELASLAELNVKQCQMRHDQCHNTYAFKWSGQNLGVMGTTGHADVHKSVLNLITSWFDEYKHASMGDIHRFSGRNLHAIGHFTAMVQDKASEVGCAVATYNSGRWNNVLLACNYSYTNVLNRRVYATGRSCSQCRTGCNRQYSALCSEREQVNPNP